MTDHKTFIRAAAAAISLALAAPAAAQDPDGDFQAWSALFVSGPASKDSRVLLWFDGHARFRDDAGDLGVSILRPGIGWRVNPDLDLWAGYARVISRPEAGADVEENRLWQQATYPIAPAFGGALAGRTRLEQRFRETGDDTGWRLRQFVRWESAARPVSLVAWNELFVNFNDADWGQNAGFDQNRLFAGAAWRPNKSVRFEGGYLNNVLNLPGASEQVNHNLSVGLFIAL